MSAHPSLLSRLWRKVKPGAVKKPAAQPQPANANTAAALAAPARRPRLSSIESLEGRIAPASVILGGKGISYVEPDGDQVSVTFSKALFTGSPASVEIQLQNVFKFSAQSSPQQLQLIDLTRLFDQNAANGLSLTVSVEKAENGDGLAHIGAIKANGLVLGNVNIKGDLGQIDVGSSNAAVALASLTVDSLGKLTDTQSGTANYESLVTGKLGSFTAREVAGGYLHVVDGVSTATKTSPAKGNIGRIVVTEQIHARAATAAANDGLIVAAGNIDSIVVGSNRAVTGAQPADGLVGGVGNDSGSIIAGGRIGTALIQGNITGGDGVNSGVLSAGKNIGRLEVRGFVLGGEGDNSGAISSGANINVLKISHLSGTPVASGIVAGLGSNSGLVFAEGSILSATVVGDIVGAASIPETADATAKHAGGISAGVALKSLTLQGSLIGGVGHNFSGFIEGLGSVGTLTVTGNVIGGDGDNSGVILSEGGATSITVRGFVQGGEGISSGGIVTGHSGAGKLASLRIDNGIVGGVGDGSGFVDAFSIGTARISLLETSTGRAALQGAGGDASGSFRVASGAASIFFGGAVAGGEGDNSGQVQVHGLVNNLTAGDVQGAVGKNSGAILARDLVTDTKITAGSFGILKVGDITGGGGSLSGQVSAAGSIGQLTAGDLSQGQGQLSGLVRAGMGSTGSGNIGTLTLGKLGLAGAGGEPDTLGGSIQVAGTVSSFKATDIFHASIAAGRFGTFAAGSVSHSIVAAEGGAVPGAKPDFAFRSITIAHDVIDSGFVAGYDLGFAPVNGHAQIGAVVVNGDWTASSLAAGVRDVEGDGFGDADDIKIPTSDGSPLVSRIASIVVKGDVTGTPATGDHFGFTARQIGAVILDGQRYTPTAQGAQVAPTTMDVTVRALG